VREDAERAYNAARDQVDKLIGDNSDAINRHLSKIAMYRTEVMLSVIREWRKKYRDRIPGFDEYIDWHAIHDSLSRAYADYIRYAFYYRFSNNLKRNILFRKILSFEIHFFCKRKVLRRADGRAPANGPPVDDAVVFYESPLAHFMAYRILKELRIKLTILSDFEQSIQPLAAFLRLNRGRMLEFLQRYPSDPPKLDDFREYLEEKHNAEWNRVIKGIETSEYRSKSAF